MSSAIAPDTLPAPSASSAPSIRSASRGRTGLVLVVEDDPHAAEAIAEVVRQVGYAVRIAPGVRAARRIADDALPDLVLVDQALPDGEGTALVRELSTLGVTDFVMISATASRDVVLDALRAGVGDFLGKPVKLSRVRRAVLGSAALQAREVDIAARPATTCEVELAGLVGRSRASRTLRRQVERLSSIPVLRALIVGPPGTDKRRVAARLHRETGAPGPALFVDCSHEVDHAAPVRFFGRAGDAERGLRAVQGYLARARGGALVLDDVSLLPRAVQSMLCTALFAASPASHGSPSERQDGSRDGPASGDAVGGRSTELECGVVGILREPARLAVSTGRLSGDLHLALSGAILEVPSLGERRDDIDEIVGHFMRELDASERLDGELADEFRVQAAERPWPGNLLQLRNALRTARVRAEPHRGAARGRNVAGFDIAPEQPAEALVGMRFGDARRELLRATFEHTGGDKRLTASLLGISLKSVTRHLGRPERADADEARALCAARPVKPDQDGGADAPPIRRRGR